MEITADAGETPETPVAESGDVFDEEASEVDARLD